MLTRRHIRIKVMQSLYSFSQRENGKVEEELKFFEKSVSNSFDLYVVLLGLFKSLADFIEDQIKTYEKIGSQDLKFQQLKFLSKNRMLMKIKNDSVLEKKLKLKKEIKWDLEFVFLKDLLTKITADASFAEYQSKLNPTWEADLNWFLACFKKHIAPSDFLYDFIEDQNITWVDDLPLVNTFLSKTIKQFISHPEGAIPFPEFIKTQEDIQFGRELLEKTLTKDEQLQKELEGKTPNWDPDRIAHLDRVILKVAIAELLFFPSIPSKVTLNEYMEITKDYSTPNSNNFVNGVLDKLVREFTDENRLNKSGRGLL